jgi:hypothetical protein
VCCGLPLVFVVGLVRFRCNRPLILEFSVVFVSSNDRTEDMHLGAQPWGGGGGGAKKKFKKRFFYCL